MAKDSRRRAYFVGQCSKGFRLGEYEWREFEECNGEVFDVDNFDSLFLYLSFFLSYFKIILLL